VLGRYFQDRGVLSRVAAVLPGFGVSGAVPELQVRPASRRRPAEDHTDSILNDVVEVTGLGQWRGDTGIEVWLPVYDLNGRPALSLVIALPHSFSSLAETALAWLTLFVAVTGILFVVPLLLVQGRTVLDPLTRMADWLRQSETAALPGRRMAWHRQDEFGTVAACIDRMLDTMERTHQSVVESEQRMRALVEANPDLFFVFDSRGEILDTSIRHTESPLLPSDAVAGRNIRNVEGIQPELATRLLEHLAAALDTDRIQVFEYSLLKPDGRMFWGEARVVRIRDDRAMVIVRDITEQRHAERERLRLEEKMQQVQKLEGLGVLAGGIAHDFNNILAAMVGHTEQAQTLLPAGAPAREAVESIRRAAMRASGLTRQLLAYAGQGTFKFRLIDVNVILSDMSELLRTTLSKKAALEVHLEQGLPLVEGDSSQVWQVVMNLLTNASDALGDQPGRIDLGTRFLRADEAALAEYMGFGALTAGDYVEVTVRDTGRGMDAQTIERIFDPFFTTKAAGRGLGLSAVLGIVRAHRGGIVVKSELGAGTTVRVVLPAARSPDGQLLRELRRPAKSSSKTTVQGSERRRVLLAEDEIDIRKLTVLVLNSIGCEVVAAANGREAVDLFAAQPQKFDLVLMDVEMPELNGEEALRAIRAIRLNVPAIVMSGYGDAVTRQRFDALAPAAYLQKPFAREDLVAVVAEIGRSPA
jgi:PAS domain S-box-containing protein